MKALLITVIVVGLSIGVVAQDKKPEASAVPQLKEGVELALTKAKLNLSDIQRQELQVNTQFQQYIQTMQQKEKTAQDDLQNKEKTALKDSGIDTDKYQLNQETLAVELKAATKPDPTSTKK